MKGFASDNWAGAHPDVLAAVAEANAEHAPAYGADRWTARAEELLAEQFGAGATALLVFNGTGANVLCLRALCRPWEGVVCAEQAHLNVDECGAPEAIAGVKLLPVATADGKLRPADVAGTLGRRGFEHAVQPRLVSVSQSTELGTVYELAELRELTRFARARGLLVHVDGARLANAAVALDAPLGAITADAGVDAVSFGGTKNGLLLGEAAIVCDAERHEAARYLRKQSLQLASKSRFIAAQFVALLEDGLWCRLAGHANAMAARLGAALAALPGVRLTQPVQANGVFAALPATAIGRLQREWAFYVWDEAAPEVRLMCSWDTTADEVDAFAGAVARACAGTPASAG